MKTREQRSSASAARQPVKPTSRRPALLVTLLFVAAGGAWLLFGRGPNFADEAQTLQRQLLSEDITPQQRRAMLEKLIRHVDKLDSQAQRALMTTVREEWQTVQQQDMDAYFAATESDRQATLDRALDRLMLIADLNAAFSPGGMRVRPPRGDAKPAPKASPKPRPPAPDAATVAAQRKAMEAYTAALEKRARERGLEVPLPGRRRQRG